MPCEYLSVSPSNWILYDNTTRLAVWLPRGDEPPTQPELDVLQKMVLMSCWWDSKGMLYHEFLERGATVTASLYSTQMDKLA